MDERLKLEEIAEGKRPFPKTEEEFAAMLEAVDDDALYQKVLVAALVQSNQMAIDTLKEGGIEPTPEIIVKAKAIAFLSVRSIRAENRKKVHELGLRKEEVPPPRLNVTEEMPPPRPLTQRPDDDAGKQEAEWLHEVKSVSGQVMYIYEDRIELTHKGIWGFLTQGLQGTKTYYFSDISTIQFKNCGWTNGFFEFTFPGGVDQPGGALLGITNDNRFTFGASIIGRAKEVAERMALINDFLQKKIREAKNNRGSVTQPLSSADEIKKFKELFDQGIISKEDFEAKKKQLLGL